MQNWTYALLLAASIIIPLLWSFEDKIRFVRKWPAVLAGVLVMMLVYIPWDIIFTQKGIWSFNHKYVTGLYIWDLPVEEWLFFVVIPFCLMFVYEVLKYFFPKFFYPKTALYLSIGLGLFFILLAILNYHRLYTFVVMLVAGVLALLQPVIRSHKTWLSHFFLTYAVSLIPFLIVNGVLTALPVVSYNDLENFGIRIFTIPVEDSVYLMGMMFIVFMVYEKVKPKTEVKKA